MLNAEAIAEELEVCIKVLRETEQELRPTEHKDTAEDIIFVAHSLEGILEAARQSYART
jgi:hypothetical protein